MLHAGVVHHGSKGRQNIHTQLLHGPVQGRGGGGTPEGRNELSSQRLHTILYIKCIHECCM